MEVRLFGVETVDVARLVKGAVEFSVVDEWEEVDRDIERDYYGTGYWNYKKRTAKKGGAR